MKRHGILFLSALLIGSLNLLLVVQVTAQTFNLLHDFTSLSGPNATNSDGANPLAGLILSGNILYGTAKYGGNSGWGNVFALNITGSGFSTPYHFSGGSDGANPSGELFLSESTLYGTAGSGGSFDAGTVFAVRTNGAGFMPLHNFTMPADNSFGFHTNSDGAYPLVSLILSGNSLYGAANDGGSSGRGTLFTVKTNGTGFVSLHSFSSGSGGAYSSGGLVLSNNVLYGANYGNLGNGTVFAVNSDGTDFTNHYAFTSGNLNNNGIRTNSDGANPHARLVLWGNTLYGTAENGGTSGNGTVFAINTDGSGFTNLHSFAGGAYNSFGLFTNSGGAHPSAGLILSGNSLYGTASAGGSSGQGTVFMLNTNGTGFTNLYGFTATPRYPAPQTNSDGATPSSGLILSGNSLYGTTAYGGSSGNGTIFSLSFAPHLTIIPSGTNIVLTWPANGDGFDFTGFILQSAPAVTGPFTNILGATSPYTNPIAGAQRFYRLRQ